MSGWGFGAYNKYDWNLVDQDYSGLSYIGKYTLTKKIKPSLLSSWHYGHFWYCDISCPVRPAVFLKIPTASAINYITPGLSIYSIYQAAPNVWRVVVSATIGYIPTGYRIWAFAPDRYLGPSGEKWGVQVFDGGGQLVFDSGRPRLSFIRWGNNYSHLTMSLPHGAESSNGARDNFFYSYYDIPSNEPADKLDIGSYVGGLPEHYDRAFSTTHSHYSQRIKGDIICFPVFTRIGRRIHMLKPVTHFKKTDMEGAASNAEWLFTTFSYYGSGCFQRKPGSTVLMFLDQPVT